MVIKIHGNVMVPDQKNTGAYVSSSPGSSGFRLAMYHVPVATTRTATISIASESGSAENPIDRGPAAISPLGPGREVADISTLKSAWAGDIPYLMGMV